MNIKTTILLSMAAISAPLVAMPTKQDIDKVSAVVQDLMRPEPEAMNAGRKTRKEVAQAAISLAEQADSEAAKLLLLKGAFNLYVRDGAFDEAVGTLKTLKETIPDMPPQIVANMIESSLRSVSKKNGGQLYRLLDETKTYIRYQNELKADLARSAKEPANRMLHLKIAEKYAVLGNWTKALEEFTKGSDRKAADIAQAERGEKTDLTKKTIADFWWDYPQRKGEEIQKAFKQHAAAIYEEAIASGDISGLTKVQTERRIEEAKGYGEIIEAKLDSNIKGFIKKLGDGVDIEFVECPAGTFVMGWDAKEVGAGYGHPGTFTPHTVKISQPFLMSKYAISRSVFGKIMGTKEVGQEKMVVMIDNNATEIEPFLKKMRKCLTGRIPKGYELRVPTEAEWEYALKATTKGTVDPSSQFTLPKDECDKIVKGMPNRWGIGHLRSCSREYELLQDTIDVEDVNSCRIQGGTIVWLPYSNKTVSNPIFVSKGKIAKSIMIEGALNGQGSFGKHFACVRRRCVFHVVIAPAVSSLNVYPR